MKTRAYWKLCFLFEGQGGRCETKLGLPNVGVLTIHILPPSHFYLSNM
jgi:hypothetical protein